MDSGGVLRNVFGEEDHTAKGGGRECVCVWCVGGCVAKLGFRKKSGLVRGLGFRVRNLII